MQPIEAVPVGMLIFLECGCAATRGITHPTGAAALVVIRQPCETHRADRTEARAIRKGTLVSPFVKPSSNVSLG